jgi:hypothetical protein
MNLPSFIRDEVSQTAFLGHARAHCRTYREHLRETVTLLDRFANL